MKIVIDLAMFSQKEMRPIFNIISNIGNSFKAIIHILLESKFKRPIPKTSNSEKCLILGNGPSLESSIQKNPAYFKKNDCLCVNNICLSEYFNAIKPKYCLFVDPAYYKERVSDFIERFRSDIFRTINEKCDWPLKVIFPQLAFPFIEKYFGSNQFIGLESFNATSIKGFKSLRYFLYTQGLACPTSYNVAADAIYVSMSMGYKRIELFGMDHSWHEDFFVDNDNMVYIGEKHFSKNDKAKPYPLYKDVLETEAFNMHELFKRLSDVFESYCLLNDYSKTIGVEIFNCSEKSYIDAFKRKSITSQEC